VARRRLPAVLALLTLAGCAPAARRGLAAGIALGGRADGPPTGALAPSPAWRDPLFAGAERIAEVLGRLEPPGALPAGEPLVGRDVPLERHALEDLHAAGRRDVRTLFAFVVLCRVEAPVEACAAAILDAERERAALDADALTLVASEARPGGVRHAFAVDMLRMGEGPFRYDFRWDFSVARRDRPDGRTLLRYEMATAGRSPEHVTLFRGAAALEPERGGTRWSEILLVGSDLSAPFFLRAKAEAAVRDILARRWRRLAARR
jgi:hypothetical protein